WDEAEPHALAAADTYSLWGLGLGSRVLEGKQDWEQSELLVSQATQGYPSGPGGPEGSFWCRRNGRGGAAAAQQFAAASVAAALKSRDVDSAERAFVYAVLQDDPAAYWSLEQQMSRIGQEDVGFQLRRLCYAVSLAGKSPGQRADALAKLRS